MSALKTPRLTMLSQEDKERIHGQSLDLLQRVGMKYNSKRAVKIMEEAGCEVDWDGLSAKIPASVIEKAIESLPSKFLLAAMDPEKDITCGDGSLYYTSSGGPTLYRDLETRERRPSTTEDLIHCIWLTEAMDDVDEWCPMVLPMELPPPMRALKVCRNTLLHCTKHVMGSPETSEDLPYFLEMMDVVAGDRSSMKERPLFSPIIHPLRPLQNAGTLIDNLLDMVDFHPPIFMQFLPLAGATSPVTLAGTVVQQNAEFLGNMTLYQTVLPGWPIIWAMACGSLDMRTGAYVGGPEAMLMGLPLIEMGKFYGLPTNTFGASSSDTHAPDFRTGVDTMFGLLNSALTGVDNMWWPADLDFLNTIDLAQTLLSAEPVRQVDRVLKGFALDDEHVMLETIVKMGFEGNYLTDPSTKKYFRKEHRVPDLLPRISYEDWHAGGEKRDEDIALAMVKEILAKHEPKPVAPEVVKELDRIYEAAEKILLKG